MLEEEGAGVVRCVGVADAALRPDNGKRSGN